MERYAMGALLKQCDKEAEYVERYGEVERYGGTICTKAVSRIIALENTLTNLTDLSLNQNLKWLNTTGSVLNLLNVDDDYRTFVFQRL